MPDRLIIACGASVAVIVGAFLYVGGWWEIRHRLRERRRGGMLL